MLLLSGYCITSTRKEFKTYVLTTELDYVSKQKASKTKKEKATGYAAYRSAHNSERSKNEVYDSQAIPALGRQRWANLCV